MAQLREGLEVHIGLSVSSDCAQTHKRHLVAAATTGNVAGHVQAYLSSCIDCLERSSQRSKDPFACIGGQRGKLELGAQAQVASFESIHCVSDQSVISSVLAVPYSLGNS